MNLNFDELIDRTGIMSMDAAQACIRTMIQESPLLTAVTVTTCAEPAAYRHTTELDLSKITEEQLDGLESMLARAMARDLQSKLVLGDQTSDDTGLAESDGLVARAKLSASVYGAREGMELRSESVIFAGPEVNPDEARAAVGRLVTETIAAADSAATPIVTLAELGDKAIFALNPKDIRVSFWQRMRLSTDETVSTGRLIAVAQLRYGFDTSAAVLVPLRLLPANAWGLEVSLGEAASADAGLTGALFFGDLELGPWMKVVAGQDIDGAPENDVILSGTEKFSTAERAAQLNEAVSTLRKLARTTSAPAAQRTAANLACSIMTALMIESWTWARVARPDPSPEVAAP